MKTLIVVDMQNDFVYGSLGSEMAQAIIPNIKNKIEEFNNSGDKIIFTKDTHFENYLETLEGKNLPIEHCIYGTNGWEIIDDLPSKNNRHVNKETFGYDEWRDEFFYLRPMRDEIELVGVCTDICVVSNALILRALYPNTKITVDASCCAGSTMEKHKCALEVMKSCQINVIGE